ncbi:hypothetical protein [Clostridium phage Villandry]|nr:hypothetical protein [Clostridium phage Villandry]
MSYPDTLSLVNPRDPDGLDFVTAVPLVEGKDVPP